MTVYKAANGEEYTLPQFHYCSEGDIVLLTTDQKAFRVYKTILIEASSVFRDMFASRGISGADISLEIESFSLFVFLRALTHPSPKRPIHSTWKIASVATDFATKYECETAARAILYTAACRDAVGEHGFEAFAVACRQNHILAASRILLDGHQGEGSSGGKSLRPISGDWSLSDAEKLSSKWLWALTCAVDRVRRRLGLGNEKTQWLSEEVWPQVTGEWLAYLTKV